MRGQGPSCGKSGSQGTIDRGLPGLIARQHHVACSWSRACEATGSGLRPARPPRSAGHLTHDLVQIRGEALTARHSSATALDIGIFLVDCRQRLREGRWGYSYCGTIKQATTQPVIPVLLLVTLSHSLEPSGRLQETTIN